METLAFLLLVTMQHNNTGVVSVSMGIFYYGYLVTIRVLHSNEGLSQTCHNIMGICKHMTILIHHWVTFGLLALLNSFIPL
jgi:hypothetical protein